MNNIDEVIRLYLDANGLSGLSLKAVLFDMDGVLFDSMPYHVRSWKETAAEYHLDAEENFYLYEGCTGDYTINLLFRRAFGREATREEILEIYNRKAELFNQYNQGEVMPGTLEVLAKVKRDGLIPVVVTGSGQHTLLAKLNTAFPDTFAKGHVVSAYDVTKCKPDPEPYLKGLKVAGVKANEALVVENAPMGVRAGVAAGIFTVAVDTGPLPEQVLLDAGANLVLPSMQNLADNWDVLFRAFLKKQ